MQFAANSRSRHGDHRSDEPPPDAFMRLIIEQTRLDARKLQDLGQLATLPMLLAAARQTPSGTPLRPMICRQVDDNRRRNAPFRQRALQRNWRHHQRSHRTGPLQKAMPASVES